MNPDGDSVFQPFPVFSTGNTPEKSLFPFLFEFPVDGCGTDGTEFFFDCGGGMKDLLLFETGRVRPDEGGKELPAHEAEIFPDGFKGGGGLRAVDGFAGSYFPRFFGGCRLEGGARSFKEDGRGLPPICQEVEQIFAVEAGNLAELVKDY
jgi:hypothetical protein